MSDPAPPPDVLLLDVMGTLVYDPFQREMPAFLGIDLEQLLAHKDPTAWAEFELGDIDEATLFARFFADRRPVDGPGLKAASVAAYRLLEGVEPLLAELYRAGVDMHALSNYPHWYREVEQRTELSRFLAWSFVSWDTGLRKPDPQAFLHAARTLGVACERCLFVDDKQRNVDAALGVGMDALRFEGAGELRVDLARRGLLRSTA